MKVIVGLPWKIDSDISGLAKRTETCFNEISELGVDTTICCLGPSSRKTKFSIKRIPVKVTLHEDVYSPLINSLGFSHEFSKQIAKEQYDVLQCFNTTSLFLANRSYLFETANPTYAYVLDVVKDEYPKTAKYQRLIKYYSTITEIDRIEYENAELIIANSEIIKDNIIKYYDVDESKIEVIPNGVSPEECDFKETYDRPDGLKIVIFPGTVHVMKGFHYLVKAMKKVRRIFPNTILLVCGRIHPYEYEMFKDLIDRNRKDSGIVLKGFIPREKLYKYYHIANVCCIPLLFGTMSIAILEAVAHGLPIITTSHSGLPEVDKVGIKVPPKDSNAIADAIITFLSDQELCIRKSENAKKVISNYYWSTIAKKFKEVYEKF